MDIRIAKEFFELVQRHCEINGVGLRVGLDSGHGGIIRIWVHKLLQIGQADQAAEFYAHGFTYQYFRDSGPCEVLATIHKIIRDELRVNTTKWKLF